MKSLTVFLLCLVLGGVYFYNTIWFQSFFLYDHFYEDIYNAPFDVTKKDESISIPIKYKYETCYSLDIAVPTSDLAHSGNVGYGLLAYRFISEKRVLAEGYTHAPSERNLTLSHGITSISILVFDLPFTEAKDDLTLELKVLEPMKFLKPFAGKISCKINPNYIAEFNKCYNEDLKTVY